MSAKRAVLGVSGSVAAYRAADLARELMRAGFDVRVCLTDAAERFVAPALFEALTGNPCLSGVFEEPQPGRMAHIDWARWADVVVIAPATANTLAKLAAGFADDMLTTLVLASAAPLVLAPAMNPAMYAAEPTASAMRALAGRAAYIVEPGDGDVACGEHGQGKLASVAAIVAATRLVAVDRRVLEGARLLVTSGPTVEPIDLARVLTNRSSGKMGAALARAGLLLGASVTVVAGPQAAALPWGVEHVAVETAREMLEATLARLGGVDLLVGAAAVADYRPAEPVEGKLRRSEGPVELRLVPNPDVLAECAARLAPTGRAVGFAAEPSAGLDTARAKLARKKLFALAANDVSRSDVGFGADENELTLLFADGRVERSGRRPKLDAAMWLLGHVAPPTGER